MTYADRQAERDSAYSTAYRDWVASLPPAERAQLAAGGLSEPDATRHTCTRQHDDATLDRTAAHEPTPDDVAELADEPRRCRSQSSSVSSVHSCSGKSVPSVTRGAACGAWHGSSHAGGLLHAP